MHILIWLVVIIGLVSLVLPYSKKVMSAVISVHPLAHIVWPIAQGALAIVAMNHGWWWLVVATLLLIFLHECKTWRMMGHTFDTTHIPW